MLAEFIDFIDAEEWELDSMQIAEVLWFVQQVSPLVTETDEEENEQITPEFEDLKVASSKQVLIWAFSILIENGLYRFALLILPNNQKAPPVTQYPLTTSSPNQEGSDSDNQNFSSKPIEQTAFPTEEKLPIKLPDTGIFRNTLELGRLIKPLKQKINSRIAQELDVKETVRKSAELSNPKFPCYFPVLTPQKERWLDVALLIEDSDSMILWQSLLKEVQDFLEHLGAFRDIKPYRLKWNDDSQTLAISSFHSLSDSISPQRLNDPSGRRLILIVSDCISQAWVRDKFINILQQWSTKGLLTLLNPFPEKMWERTNLDYSIRIRLGNQKKGLPTQKWLAIPLESWQIKGVDKKVLQTLVKLPILSLESESMGAWVNVMMGKGISLCSGIWLGTNLMYPEDEDYDDQEEENLSQQINDFYATSSPEAWELIQWLSAIPVTLSTIRLVQRTLLPEESTQVNVAEVLMGGLLSPVKPFNSYQSPHQIQFEFKPGIREAFLERLGKSEFCLGVIGSLSAKIASHFGYQTIREFEATLLTNPLEFRGDEDLELIQAFATISVSTLRQYGEEYAPYIRKLDRSRARLNLLSEVEGDSVSLNWIDFLENIAKQLDFTEMETEILINLLPTPQKTCSLDEVAKHLHLTLSDINNLLTNIYPKLETLKPDLFPSENSPKLEVLQQYLSSQYHLKSTSPQFPELETYEVFEFEADIATIVFEDETNNNQSTQENKLNTILLVEDRAEVIEDISKLLSSPYGITVRGTDNVNEVIKQVESGEIDLILINYDLPNSRHPEKGNKVNGIEIVHLLREELKIAKFVPIIGFSILVNKKEEFLRYADGFYDRSKTVEEEDKENFINYLRKIFQAQKNYAIAIGINQYNQLPLKYAVRDAEVMKHWFDGQNFSQVDLLPETDLATVREFVTRQFEKPFLSAEDNLWFFFSGHSRIEEDVDYLMLADSRTEDVPNTALALNSLVQQLLSSGAGKVILFLDMDRLPAKSPSSSSSSFLIEGKKDNQDVIIFYACDANTAAYEIEQLRQGSFTYALQEALLATQGNLSLNRLMNFLGDRIGELNQQYNRPMQTPQRFMVGTDLGDWIPFPSNLQVFDCKTPRVNRRGETIKQDSKLVQYFAEVIPNDIFLEMIAIPGGTFIMGSPKGEGGNSERPQHQVTVPPFFMGKYPITQAQWKAIASRTDLKVEIDLDPHPSRFKGDNRPVERVNWYEAVEFCQRLSKLTGREYRLPSEAQWEYACRAIVPPLAPPSKEGEQELPFTKGEQEAPLNNAGLGGSEELTVEEWNEQYNQPFYFGETITGKLANYSASSTYADEPKGEYRSETTPVGQFPPNAFGLYDMHGNVWEWCADDWHGNYKGGPTDGSAWLDDNEVENINNENESDSDKSWSHKVLRGGSWYNIPGLCRSATRYFITRANLNLVNGFRVVCVFGRTL